MKDGGRPLRSGEAQLVLLCEQLAIDFASTVAVALKLKIAPKPYTVVCLGHKTENIILAVLGALLRYIGIYRGPLKGIYN